MPVYISRRKFVLGLLDTNIRAQTMLDAIFESDDEDVRDSKRRRMLSGSDSEEVMKVMGQNILMPVS